MADIGLADALTALGDFDEAMRISRGPPCAPALTACRCSKRSSKSRSRCSSSRAAHYRDALGGLRGIAPPLRAARPCRSTWPSRKSNWPTRISNCTCCPKRSRCSTRRWPSSRRWTCPTTQAWTLAQNGRAQVLLGDPEAAADSLVRAAASVRGAGQRRRRSGGRAGARRARASRRRCRRGARAQRARRTRFRRGRPAGAPRAGRRGRAPMRCCARAARRQARALFDATLVSGRANCSCSRCRSAA